MRNYVVAIDLLRSAYLQGREPMKHGIGGVQCDSINAETQACSMQRRFSIDAEFAEMRQRTLLPDHCCILGLGLDSEALAARFC